MQTNPNKTAKYECFYILNKEWYLHFMFQVKDLMLSLFAKQNI